MTQTNETPQQKPEASKAPYGNRLKEAREELGLDRKAVADQLRLNEKIILMMEKDRYPQEIPITFIKGYLRAYSRFLQIPEYEVNRALDNIKAKNHHYETPYAVLPAQEATSSNYFMQFLTSVIVVTMVGLVGTWWYTHNIGNTSYTTTAMNQTKLLPSETLNTATPNNLVLAEHHAATSDSNIADKAADPVVATPANKPDRSSTEKHNDDLEGDDD